MKQKKLLRAAFLVCLAALALWGSGCRRNRPEGGNEPSPGTSPTEKPTPGSGQAGEDKPFEGEWADVNGDTTLEIKGDTLTVRFGKWADEYRFRVEKTASGTVLRSTEEYGDFGIMSQLEVREDGSLWAYEQVLDAEGHTYHFVRPEALAAEKEIRDLSKDAPKEIASTEIKSFSLGFRNNGGSYGLDDRWPSGSYTWELKQQEDGSCRMEFRVMGDSYVALHYSDTVSADYAEGLAKRLTELGIPAYNGYYKTNSVQKPGYSLYVTYASGEKLTVRAYGDAGDTCVFDLPALLDYAAERDLFESYED